MTTSRLSQRQGTTTGPSATPDLAFAEPDVAYGPHAFWFWNGPDDMGNPGHFARMATEMASQGLNPGYAHARFWHPEVAFWQTPAWHHCFQTAVEATARTGAKLSYVLGDPSFPDKYILPEHPELKAASLAWTTAQVPGGATADLPAEFFNVAAQREASGKMRSASLIILPSGPWQAPAGDPWTVWSFTLYHAKHPGGTAINVLDHRTTAHWLALENDRYTQTCGSHFGKTMDCVFFDHEGSYGYKLAWSDDLARIYQEATGSDIRRWMPLLIEEDVEGRWAKARWDWFDAIGRAYRACLLEPLDAWCRQRGMAMTCHLWEERLVAQALQTGGYMAGQRAYAMPGTDALFLEVFQPRAFKETQSVCEFEGRQCMSEALGIAGWHLTPTQMKRAANAGVAWGLTRWVLHGVNSRRDLIATSYPPDFFDWNPYWRHFHCWSGFVRRASFVNDHGRLDAQVLLLCPLDSVCALLGDGIFEPAKPHDSYLIQGKHDADASHAPEIAAIDAAYSAAIAALTTARVGHLIADSHYLKRMDVEAGRLRLGEFAFTTLVLPPLKLLPLACAERIAAFAATGGRVIALDSLPDASAEHGVGDLHLRVVMDQLRAAPGFVAAPASLDALARLQPDVTCERGAFPLITSRRRLGDRLFLWLANNSDTAQTSILIVPAAQGRATRWDCEDGTTRAIPSDNLPGGASRVELTFAPNEGFWLVFDPAQAPMPRSPAVVVRPLQLLDGPWRVRIDAAGQPNPAQHRLAAPAWLLGPGESRPLASWLAWDLRQFSGFVDYHRDIELADPQGDEILDLGRVRHLAEVWINDVCVGARLWAPYAFHIGVHLRPGRNSLRIRLGNLILNTITQYPDYAWPWHGAPSDDQLDAGLFGPVTLHSTSQDLAP